MSLDFNQDHFALFGLPRTFALDAQRLDRVYRDIQAQVHPDRFAHAGEAERRLAMQWASRVNEAYQTLKRPFERARYLLSLHGVDAMDPRDTSMPADFLMQQMAWRESLAEAVEGGDPAALLGIETELRAHAAALQGELAHRIDAAQDYPGAAGILRKWRFIDKLLEEAGAAHESL